MVERDAWVVYTNTDLTEGRGYDYPMAICSIEATANRLARGAYIQGTMAPIKKITIMQNIWGEWVGPIHLIEATKEDLHIQKCIDEENKIIREKQAILEKAKRLGLTDEEIKTLSK